MSKALKVFHADAKRVVDRDFQPELRHRVWALLNRLKDGTPDEDARIQLVVLKLAAGNIDRVSKLVEDACEDWRPLICEAEGPEENAAGWRAIQYMDKEELKRLRKRDLDQYHEWLYRESIDT
jgi:hypothetical protein